MLLVRRLRRSLPKRLEPPHMLVLAVIGLGVISLLGIHHGTPNSNEVVLREGHGTAAATSIVKSRSLLATKQTHQRVQHMPHAPNQQHAFLVLDPEPLGSRVVRDLQPHLAPLRQHPDAIAISSLLGPAAISLAAQFLVPAADLPAVVYVAPMWEKGAGFKQTAVYSLNDNPPAGLMAWIKRNVRLVNLLMNDWDGTGNSICFYFVDEAQQKEVELSCPGVSEEVWEDTSLLDKIVARNRTTKALLAERVMLFSGLFTVHPPGFCNYLVDRSCYPPILPVPTDPEVVSKRKFANDFRLQAMNNQPKEFHHYTTVGFEKRRAPPELFQALSGYFNSSWDNLAREMWPDEDIFTNHFESPSYKITLPETGPLKPRLFNIVREILEKWIGGKTPLESTAMYGIRIYTTNNKLGMHCDRPDTHIVSSILNIGSDVDEPWPLQIKDHSGKEHSVLMEPGDMVLYEGATCAHGRELPLKGRYFANVFVHFKPRESSPRV